MNDLHVSVLANLDWHALSTHWILTLAHFLWQGAAIGLLTATLLAVFQHSSARLRHGICLLALAGFIPCLVVTWMSVNVDKYLAASSMPENSSADREPISLASPLPASEEPAFPQPVSFPESGTEDNQVPSPRENVPSAATPASSPPLTAESLLSRIAPLIAAAYFLGVLLFLARTSLGLWGGRKLRTLSEQIHDSELIRLIEQQGQRIGLRTVPVVAYCSRVAVPTVIGVLKPVVLLPASLVTHLETDQLAAILSHEFAHIRRHDLFVNLLQRVTESVLFFHPAVWWISRRISVERENCCDDLASASGFGNLQYAGALLRMAELCLPQRGKKFASQLVALSAEGSNATHFSRRIERLLKVPGTPRLAVSRLSAVFAVLLSLVSVGVLAQIADKQPVDQNPIAATKKENKEEAAAVDQEETSDKEAPSGSQASKITSTTETENPNRPKSPPEGLKFLQPYPKLYSLSRGMTEVQFLTIVQREKLKVHKNPLFTSYSIPTGDGNIVYVNFIVFGIDRLKCSGISLHRIRGEAPKAETPPAIVDSNGIYWSEFVTDGLRVGAKLKAKYGQLTAGEKLVVQYYLMNETNGKKTVSLVPSEPVFPSLKAQNRIDLSLFPANTDAKNFSIGAGLYLERYQAEIDTTGFLPGRYLVVARNLFWRSDAENPNHKDGLPARLELPLTIVSKESDPRPAATGTPTRSEGIDWGEPVAGLQVGSRFLGDSTLFGPGASPQMQLFVRNVTDASIDVQVFLPHPADGWLINVENPQGNNILLERTPIDIAYPVQSVKLKIAVGETMPLTGVKQSINDRPPSEIKNSSFRIERQKPDGDFWQGGILVSQGGEYRAIHTVTMKRDDIPGVRLSVDSGKSEFRVSGPELKNDESEKNDNPEPGEQGEAAIRLWKARLVDGVTGKPLPGITVRVRGAISSKSEPQAIELVSSGQGIITVPLREGTFTSVDAQTSGWWSGPYQFIGQPPGNPNPPPQKDGEPVSDPKVPRDIKLWRGDTVTGKLLYPDKSPAGGVLLNVGVYINHMEWKKRLGMDLTFYSFDHGQWPNWSRAIMTNDDGTFATTVPPAAARSWVRVGTAWRAFAFIQPEHIEAESTGKALAACVPFDAELEGNNPGYGYRIVDRIVQPGPRDDLLNFGTLQLIAGIRVRGRVIDAHGNGLAGIRLRATDAHGSHCTWSGADGRFEFLPVEAGWLTIHPDARLSDAEDKAISRDLPAVFIDRQYPVVSEAIEVIVKAVPHVELEFEWKDRRAEQADRVSYYGHFKGHFKVVGQYPLDDEERVYWNGETTLIERDGRKFQVVKVPRKLMNPTLVLPQDRVVTASYEDETGKTSGPGRVELGDFTQPIHRIIYGDEPKQHK